MKCYRVTREEAEEGEATTAFASTKGNAKRLGREWNDGKKLTAKSGIEVEQVDISGGKQGVIDFLNELVGFTASGASKSKKKGGKPEKKGRRLKDDEVPEAMQRAADEADRAQGAGKKKKGAEVEEEAADTGRASRKPKKAAKKVKAKPAKKAKRK